jgi:hypothetical protein
MFVAPVRSKPADALGAAIRELIKNMGNFKGLDGFCFIRF